MSIVVTGATGNLGGHAVDALIRRGVEPSEIVGAGRNPERLAEQAAKGVRTARFDVDDPTTLATIFDDAEAVLLVSIPGNPRRAEQQGRVIDAARAAGVGRLVYTSFVTAAPDGVQAAHFATEEALRGSGVPHVVLRNGVYFDFFLAQIPEWRAERRVVGAAGDGRFSAAAVADLAEAAAVVLTAPGHEDVTYVLGSDEAFTMADLAAELSRQTGEAIPYVDVSADELRSYLVGRGMSEAAAEGRVRIDRTLAAGEYFVDTGDLARLLDREPMTLAEAVADAVEGPAG